MSDIPIGSIWSFLKWLPGAILRRAFPPSRLSDLLLMDVRPRHHPVRINLGEPASFDVWFRVINLSPFDVEIDRASLELWCGGVVARATVLDRTPVASGRVIDVLFRGSLTDEEANLIVHSGEVRRATVEVSAQFNCTLHNFSKRTGQLGGINLGILNESLRLPHQTTE
jgi:hypothetical protein